MRRALSEILGNLSVVSIAVVKFIFTVVVSDESVVDFNVGETTRRYSVREFSGEDGWITSELSLG